MVIESTGSGDSKLGYESATARKKIVRCLEGYREPQIL